MCINVNLNFIYYKWTFLVLLTVKFISPFLTLNSKGTFIDKILSVFRISSVLGKILLLKTTQQKTIQQSLGCYLENQGRGIGTGSRLILCSRPERDMKDIRNVIEEFTGSITGYSDIKIRKIYFLFFSSLNHKIL